MQGQRGQLRWMQAAQSVKGLAEDPSSISSQPYGLGQIPNLLCLSFLIHETGTITVPASQG